MALNRYCDELFLEFATYAQWDETDSSGNILSTGFPEWDKDKFNEFVDKYKGSLGVKGDDRLKKCFYKKVLTSIIKRMEDKFRKDDFSLESFIEIEESYFEEFKNLREAFQEKIRIFKDIEKNKKREEKKDDAGEHSKYKRFLEREPASHLKMLLKQAGYKGFAKMNKGQLIALILKEINA